MPDPIPSRRYRLLAALLTLWASWWLMMASHELGHIAAAHLTHGNIAHINLSPAGLSQTHLATNPHPHLVVWAGPIIGVLSTGLVYITAIGLRKRGKACHAEPAFAFLAGFCLIANGLYIGLGWIDRIGDTHVMLQQGTPIFVMIGFGVLCLATGLTCWHQLGAQLWLKEVSSLDCRRLTMCSITTLATGWLIHLLLP